MLCTCDPLPSNGQKQAHGRPKKLTTRGLGGRDRRTRRDLHAGSLPAPQLAAGPAVELHTPARDRHLLYRPLGNCDRSGGRGWNHGERHHDPRLNHHVLGLRGRRQNDAQLNAHTPHRDYRVEQFGPRIPTWVGNRVGRLGIHQGARLWGQLRDDDGVAEPEEGFLCMLFNSQSDTDIIDFYRWRILVIEDGGYLSLQKHPGTAAGDDSGIVVTEDKPYLMTTHSPIQLAGYPLRGSDCV